MDVQPAAIPDVLLIQPRVFRDERGHFLETWQEQRCREAGLPSAFVQDNFSHSVRGTVRGLHYQIQRPQGKLVHVSRGRIVDVVVDMRRSAPTFGQHVRVELDGESHRMIYVPPGFAHGFCVLSDTADIAYRCTDYYAPEYERTLLWNDPALGIDWPLAGPPVVSSKDEAGRPLADADCFA